jgi:hypothetical protein
MGIDNIYIAKVVNLPDKDGVEHFTDYYTNLAESAIQTHQDKVKFHFIKKALKRLELVEKADLPDPRNGEKFTFEFDIDVDGKSYSRELEIVKKLGKAPVYELKVDIDEFNWYFRGTFFPQYFNRQLHYCFVHAFEKVPGYPDPTDGFRDSTHEVYMDTRINPDKYSK